MKNFILFLFFLSGCSAINHVTKTNQDNNYKAWITAFKDRVFIKCLDHSYPKSDSILSIIGRTDAFNPYDGIYNYLDTRFGFIDSLGASVYKKVQPLWLDDFKGRNTYLCNCLHYYSSLELDSIAKAEYKNYIKKLNKY
jgi:hypothetical protein